MDIVEELQECLLILANPFYRFRYTRDAGALLLTCEKKKLKCSVNNIFPCAVDYGQLRLPLTEKREARGREPRIMVMFLSSP